VLRLLDAYSGAGGAGCGYSLAGFDVTGIDHRPMPRYPFRHIVGDALEYIREHGHEYSAIHCSPPCQQYSVTRTIHGRTYPDLVAVTRQALIATGRPWVIENVIGAPLRQPVMLCGTMFGLRVYRHRLFESNVFLMAMSHPKHYSRPVAVGRQPQPGEFMTVAGHFSDVAYARRMYGHLLMDDARRTGASNSPSVHALHRGAVTGPPGLSCKGHRVNAAPKIDAHRPYLRVVSETNGRVRRR